MRIKKMDDPAVRRKPIGYSLLSMIDIGPNSLAEERMLRYRKAAPEPPLDAVVPDAATPAVLIRPSVIISDGARGSLRGIVDEVQEDLESALRKPPEPHAKNLEPITILPPLDIEEPAQAKAPQQGTSFGLSIEITGPGGQTRNEWIFGETEIIIGRSDSCNVQIIDDCKVSRRHLSISLEGNQMLVCDLGSSNGTYFTDGTPIRSKERYSFGFFMRIGDSKIFVSRAMKTDNDTTGERSISTTMGKGQINYSMRTPDDFLVVPIRPDPAPIGDIGHNLMRQVLLEQERQIRGLMGLHPLPFRISRMVKINGSLVRFGSTMKLSRYDAIPLFITKDDRTYLVFAYQSMSQASWRRFAGYKDCIFWKGRSEHLQNFDYRIQRVLDGIYDKSVPTLIGKGTDLLGLQDLGLNVFKFDGESRKAADHIVKSVEDVLQGSMVDNEPHIDFTKQGNLPHRLISYWWAGNDGGVWGRYLSLVCESANRDYIYGIAITEDGMMLQYIQRERQGEVGINTAGAPALGVPVPKEYDWLFTPVFEYSSQVREVKAENVSRLEVIGTVLGGGHRVRVWGLHESTKSPFFQISNGFNDVYRMLRREDNAGVERFMNRIISDGGELPRIGTPPAEPRSDRLRIEADARWDTLFKAFSEYVYGRLDLGTEHGRRYAIENGIGKRELKLFQRYSRFVDDWNGDVDSPVVHMVKNRFMKEAERWARDKLNGK